LNETKGMSERIYSVERLGERTWRVVEDDPYHQYPFLYVVIGVDKCVLIDTGCGTGDYRSYVSTHINKSNLPYLVVCTHVHFDHIGGNHAFTPLDSLGICFGARNKVFTQNYAINSLAAAHLGAKVLPFTITRWLQEGDRIYLDDKQPTKALSLEVLYSPGHTFDSISLYFEAEHRLFVGDFIYPYTSIHCDCIGSNGYEYQESLNKLLLFISNHQTDQDNEASHQQNETPTSFGGVDPQNSLQKQTADEFLSLIGLDSSTASAVFNVHQILELADWSISNAANLYFTNIEDISSIAPPIEPAPKLQKNIKTIQLSCGHVADNLPIESVSQMAEFIDNIYTGVLPPNSVVDKEFAEFTSNNFSIILPLTFYNSAN